MQLFCLLPPWLQNPSCGFWGKVEKQCSPCLCHISLCIDISVPKTAREVNSCWMVSSISLLLLLWCSGPPVARHTQTPEAQIYLYPWFSVSPHLFRWILWLYVMYALFAFLPIILHPTSSYTSIQSLCYVSLFFDVPIAIPNLWVGCFSAQRAIYLSLSHTQIASLCCPLSVPPQKKTGTEGEVKSIPFAGGLHWTKYHYQQPDSITGWSVHIKGLWSNLTQKNPL